MERLPLSYEKTKYFMEIPEDPTDTNRWDLFLYRLGKTAPHHYYIDEDSVVKRKRIAKKRIFQYILRIAEQVLTPKQFEAFSLYYDFYPHKTIGDISKILDISFWATNGRLKSARFNVLKAILTRISNELVKRRINMELKKTRELRNKTTRKWRHRTGWDGRYYISKRS